MPNRVLELTKTLTLDVSRWDFGRPKDDDTRYSSGDCFRELVNRRTGNMTALGMFMVQSGMAFEELTGMAGPTHAKVDILTLERDGAEFASVIIRLNDDFDSPGTKKYRRTMEEKIDAIKKAVEHYGHSFRVVGLPKNKKTNEPDPAT